MNLGGVGCEEKLLRRLFVPKGYKMTGWRRKLHGMYIRNFLFIKYYYCIIVNGHDVGGTWNSCKRRADKFSDAIVSWKGRDLSRDVSIGCNINIGVNLKDSVVWINQSQNNAQLWEFVNVILDIWAL